MTRSRVVLDILVGSVTILLWLLLYFLMAMRLEPIVLHIRRRYSRNDLAAADAFSLAILGGFEPPGELCGTVYDEASACPRCGAGVIQVSGLRLDLRKAPRNKDIARTIADEWIVSQRLAKLMTHAGLSEFALYPVQHVARYEDDPIDLSTLPTGASRHCWSRGL
jgi:hypothetical protein